MSAPTPATGDGSPAPGYYPDPSIPGYVRYWNGAAWVPGTSRPAPSGGGAAPVPRATPAPPAVEETGPVFFDEEPLADAAQEPASAWQADVSRQSGFGGERDHRVSWGAPGEDPRIPAPSAPPADPAPTEVGRPVGEGALVVRGGRRAEGTGGEAAAPGPVTGRDAGAVGTERPSEPGDTRGPAADFRAAVAAPQRRAAAPARPQLPAPPPAPARVAPAAPAVPAARPPATPPAPAERQAEPPVVPWKQPTEDPFLRAARTQAAGRPGGLGKRLLARLVDTVVLGALLGAPAVLVVGRVRTHVDEKVDAARQTGKTVTVWLLDGTTAGYAGALVAVMLLAGVLYEVLPTVRWGRTLGKALFRLEVRGIESHERPGFGAALLRWLVYGVLGLLAVGVLNVLWCLVDRPWRQCWHDKLARTFVARRVRA